MRLERNALDEGWNTKQRLRRAIYQLEVERGRHVLAVERIALEMGSQLQRAIEDAQRPAQAWTGVHGQYVYPHKHISLNNPTWQNNIDRHMGAIAALDEVAELLQEVYNGKIPDPPA